MSVIVQKFGGTSLATADRIHRAARRAIRAKLQDRQVVIVVSAMGDTTDRLLSLAHQMCSDPPKRELDMLLTTGEQVSIALMAMAIDAAGHRAISLTAGQLGLYSDSFHTRARIRRISRERIARELDEGKIVIVAGFQGIDESGEITTLGRGASDTTAAALACVLGAQACEIYTDVDGVYTADPRLVPQARKINRISYDAMLEMAAAGAQVMHSRAIELAKKFNVPIHVRSSLTDAEGTMITHETPDMEAFAVQGVTLKQDLAMLTLVGVPNHPGDAARIFAAIAREGILVDDIMQNISDGGNRVTIGLTISASDLKDAQRVCDALTRDLGIERIEVQQNVAKVSATGVGMRSHCGVAAAMFDALAHARINIERISTSEIVISCIIRESDGPNALRAVHDAFHLDRGESQAPSDAA